VEVERFNYFRKDSDCKNICNTNIYVSSQFNLCAKRYRDIGQQVTKFIWKGKDKVKRLSLICDLDKGGLKAPLLESIIKSQRIMCCKKFAKNQQSNWKIILSHYSAVAREGARGARAPCSFFPKK